MFSLCSKPYLPDGLYIAKYFQPGLVTQECSNLAREEGMRQLSESRHFIIDVVFLKSGRVFVDLAL